MGRSYRWQESHAKLCFLKMLGPGIFSLRLYASGYELMAMTVFDCALSKTFARTNQT